MTILILEFDENTGGGTAEPAGQMSSEVSPNNTSPDGNGNETIPVSSVVADVLEAVMELDEKAPEEKAAKPSAGSEVLRVLRKCQASASSEKARGSSSPAAADASSDTPEWHPVSDPHSSVDPMVEMETEASSASAAGQMDSSCVADGAAVAVEQAPTAPAESPSGEPVVEGINGQEDKEAAESSALEPCEKKRRLEA